MCDRAVSTESEHSAPSRLLVTYMLAPGEPRRILAGNQTSLVV